jgi:hypothetical protein
MHSAHSSGCDSWPGININWHTTKTLKKTRAAQKVLSFRAAEKHLALYERVKYSN